MKTILNVAIILILSVGCLNAQEDKVTKIRQIYNDYNKLIKSGEENETPWVPGKITISKTTMERAIGSIEYQTILYYDENEEEIEDKDGNVNFVSTKILRKVVLSQQRAFKTYEEIMFDEKGDLIFYYIKDEAYACGEKRLYFNSGKLIKIVGSELIDYAYESEEKDCVYTRSGNSLIKKDIEIASQVISQSKKYLKLLDQL